MYSDAVIISLIGSSFAALGLFSRLLYKSKCSDIDIGCIHIRRDIPNELKQTDSFSDVEIGKNSPK